MRVLVNFFHTPNLEMLLHQKKQKSTAGDLAMGISGLPRPIDELMKTDTVLTKQAS